ncbi:MAG: hypothetical protein VZQ80_03795 [Lachnospiraceae bacterium]|nr:hypothetical protein [Lachnospiraceae bacterium]
MKKFSALFSAAIFAAAILFGTVTTAFAAGTSQLAFSKSNVTVGDSFTVTVTASGRANMTLKYSSSYVTLTDSKGASTTGNSVTFTATTLTFTFQASAAGKADFIVSSPDGSVTGCSASLTVAGQAPAEIPAETPVETPAETPMETPAEKPTETPAEAPTNTANADNAAGEATADPNATADSAPAMPEKADLEYNGVYYAVSERYSDSQIPTGFSKVQMTIGSKTFNELTNGVVNLIYMKEVSADGTMADTGSFFLYDSATGTVLLPMELVGSTASYVIAMDPGENSFSNILTQTSFEYTAAAGPVTIERAYVLEGSGEGFYYIYGMDESGTIGWFVYSAADGTIQTADTALLDKLSADAVSDVSSQNTDTTGTDIGGTEGTSTKTIRLVKTILIVVIVLVVLLIVINLLPKKQKSDEEELASAAADDLPPVEEPEKKLRKKEKKQTVVEGTDGKSAGKNLVSEKTIDLSGQASAPEETDDVTTFMPTSEEISKEMKQEELKTEGEAAKADAVSGQKTENAPADIPVADPAEDSRSALYWARKNFYNGKTGKMPSTDELFYGAEPIATPPLSASKTAGTVKDKKGGKKGDGPDSGSGDGSSDGGNNIDVMDLNDL